MRERVRIAPRERRRPVIGMARSGASLERERHVERASPRPRSPAPPTCMPRARPAARRARACTAAACRGSPKGGSGGSPAKGVASSSSPLGAVATQRTGAAARRAWDRRSRPRPGSSSPASVRGGRAARRSHRSCRHRSSRAPGTTRGCPRRRGTARRARRSRSGCGSTVPDGRGARRSPPRPPRAVLAAGARSSKR